MKFSRSAFSKAGAAVLAVAALGAAGMAQARSDVFFSIGANVAPGVSLGVSNAPVYNTYSPPVYYQPQPAYVQPAPVYYPPPVVYSRPAPVYYAPPPVYYRPAPVFGVTYYGGGGRHHGHRR